MHNENERRPAQKWSIKTGLIDGTVFIARVNTTARELFSSTKDAVRWDLVTLLDSVNMDKTPSADENLALQQIEEELCETLSVAEDTALVAVITLGAMRRFLIYTVKPEITQTLLHQFREKYPFVQLSEEPDPEWTAYNQLL